MKFVSKITEKAVACQLKNYLTDNNLEEPLQSAYKRFRNTETALIKVQNDILRALDNPKCVELLLLDKSAAFDTVDHDLLLEKMSNRLGIEGQVLKWFRSYLLDQRQFLRVDRVNSAVKICALEFHSGLSLARCFICCTLRLLGIS